MLFHQYGNYVVQRMLSTCIEAARARVSGIHLHDMDSRLEWLHRLRERILHSEGKLSKYVFLFYTNSSIPQIFIRQKNIGNVG